MAKVETVLGRVPSEDLGITLPHEHLLLDITCWCVKPSEASKLYLWDSPVTIEKLGVLRRDPQISKDAMQLTDESVAVEELGAFMKMGGRTLVDVTIAGLARDPKALERISIDTGVNIIMGSGFYLERSHPAFVKKNSAEELSEIIVRELMEGVNGSGIRAGVIGEIGCSSPITDEEKKVLKASALAQRETGRPLTVHPSIWDLGKRALAKNENEILDLLLREDADLTKFYMSHMDYTCTQLDYQRHIMDEYKITIDYDTFGQEGYPYSIFPGAFEPSDRQRIAAVIELCKEGYEKQLMLSQDICKKIHLLKYGGTGYAHILEDIVPELTLNGVTRTQINTMLVENPKRILAC